MAGLAGSGGNSNISFAAGGESALATLIKLLQGGGTEGQKQDRQSRTQATQRTAQTQADYSKNNAFADAQGAMQAMITDALAKALPSITRAAEGAGTSQNSMRALMIQQAAAEAAKGAAGLGLQAAVNYGGVANNAASVLERLTTGDDPVISGLLNALQIAKGGIKEPSSVSRQPTQAAPVYSSAMAPSGLPEYGVRDPYAGMVMGYSGPRENLGTGGTVGGLTTPGGRVSSRNAYTDYIF